MKHFVFNTLVFMFFFLSLDLFMNIQGVEGKLGFDSFNYGLYSLKF